EVLDGLLSARKILIHINNTNPILDLDSPERAELDAHGSEVAFDGMSIRLYGQQEHHGDPMSQTAMSPAEFEQALRANATPYHIHHPFLRARYEARATHDQKV